MEISLPRDGAVLVVDDKIEEATPLLEALYKHAIPAYFYEGDEKKLPENKLDKLRVAFVDLQLFPQGTPHAYAQKILGILDKLISDSNGPYVLVIWSTTGDINADELEKQIMADGYNKSPIVCLRLNKTDYFEKDFDKDALLDYLEFLDEELGNYLDPDDFDEIKKRTESYYSRFTYLKPKDNILEKIFKEIEKELKQLQSFNLLVKWEELVHKSSTKVVYDYSSLFSWDKFWDDNIKGVILKLAKTRIGENIKSTTLKNIVTNAFRAINLSLSDQIEKIEIKNSFISGLSNFTPRFIYSYTDETGRDYSFRELVSGEYTLYLNGSKLKDKQKRVKTFINNVGGNHKDSIKKAVKNFTDVKPILNTIFIIDPKPSDEIYPGNIYEKEVDGRSKRKLLKTYIEKDKVKKASKENIDKIKFIEMEVSPVCDYAHDKWLKSRLLPGIMVPIGINLNIKRSGSTSSYFPQFYYNDELFTMAFDFRLMKAVEIKVVKERKPILRLKKEPLMDLINQQSTHISRVGFTVLD